MQCPMCKHPAVDVTLTGHLAVHRIYGKDRYTFCPMSGEAVEVAVRWTEVA